MQSFLFGNSLHTSSILLPGWDATIYTTDMAEVKVTSIDDQSSFLSGWHWPWHKRRSEADRKIASQAEALLDVAKRNIELGRSVNDKAKELNQANKRAQAVLLLDISRQIRENNQRLIEVVGTAVTKQD